MQIRVSSEKPGVHSSTQLESTQVSLGYPFPPPKSAQVYWVESGYRTEFSWVLWEWLLGRLLVDNGEIL